jgi:hypothetical protein
VPVTPVHDLRRIAEAVSQLRGLAIRDVEIRADCRMLRLALGDGQLLLVTCVVDDAGKPRLDVALVRPTEESGRGQLEVPFGELG